MDLSHRARYQQLEDDDDTLYADSPTKTRRRPSELHPSQPPPHRYRRIASFFLVALFSSLATLIILLLLDPSQTRSDFTSSLYRNLPLTYPPNLPHNQLVIFNPDSRYTQPGWETAYDRLSLNIPPHSTGGFIAVPNPSLYNLHGGTPLLPLHNNDSSSRSHPIPQEKYTLSVFHQIHCIKILRVAMRDLIARKPRLRGGVGGGFTEHEDHCWEYIRLGIVCAADMAVEMPIMEKGEGSGGGRSDTDGWGTGHFCRKWEDVDAFARDKAFTKWWDWEKFPSGSSG